MVARYFLCQNGLSVLLSQANLSITELKRMVVVCYRTYHNCWFSQRSRFLADLPVLHYWRPSL